MPNSVLNSIADFTWMWNDIFFLETSEGNYLWSDPDYGGDNKIRRYHGTHKDLLKHIGHDFSRAKGRHTIKEYCPGATVEE